MYTVDVRYMLFASVLYCVLYSLNPTTLAEMNYMLSTGDELGWRKEETFTEHLLYTSSKLSALHHLNPIRLKLPFVQPLLAF